MKIKAFYQKKTQGSLRLNLSSTTKTRGSGSQKLRISSSKTRKWERKKGWRWSVGKGNNDAWSNTSVIVGSLHSTEEWMKINASMLSASFSNYFELVQTGKLWILQSAIIKLKPIRMRIQISAPQEYLSSSASLGWSVNLECLFK